MGRFKRRFRGNRPNRDFHGPRNVRPNRPHFRNFRREQSQQPQQQPQQQQSGATKPAEIPVYQARGPGHLRIMGKIEYDVRTLLKVIGTEPDKTILYLACAREMYSDYENNKALTIEAALEKTTARWLERGFDEDLIKRIRAKVTQTWQEMKVSKPEPPKPPLPDQTEVAAEPGL